MSTASRASDERPTDSAETFIFLKYRSSKWFILATICVASFSDAFIYGVIIPVLPLSLRERSGVLEDDVPFWNSMLLAAFGAAQFSGSPLFGWFADQISSRRTPLLIGFVSNAVATALLCFIKSVGVLLVSRFLQGLSAAIVYTVGFALLIDTVGSKDIAQWMGYVIACLNVGMTISPFIGGILYAKTGYLSLFVVMFGLIALDILMRTVMVEKKVAIKWAEQPKSNHARIARDYGTLPSSVDQAACERPKPTSSNCDGNSDSNDEPDKSANSTDTRDQTKASHNSHQVPPLIHLLTSPRVLTNLYGVVVSVTVLASFDSALPIFVERTFGWKSIGGGVVFLPITMPVLAAPLIGKLVDMMDSRWISVSGFILSALFLMLLTFIEHDGHEQKIFLFILLLCYGSARIVGSTPLGADLAREVERMAAERPGIFGDSGAYAQVFALYTSASAAGVLVGPAWTSFAYGKQGWTFLIISLGTLSASVAVPLLFSESKRRNKDREDDSSAV